MHLRASCKGLTAAAVVNAINAGVAGTADTEGGETSSDTSTIAATTKAKLYFWIGFPLGVLGCALLRGHLHGWGRGVGGWCLLLLLVLHFW